MPVQEFVDRVLKNQAQILRYVYVLQAFAGAVLLIVAYIMGRGHFHLIQQGVRAPGTIVGHQQQYFTDRARGARSTLAFMPIVEFRADEQVVRFQDWKGSSSAGDLRDRVTVLYDRAHPSDAMIDRAVWNWLPWAPIGAVGVFLTLVAIKGWLQSN